MEYAVYIPVPRGDDADLIANAASAIAPVGFEFSIREHGDPSQSSDTELFFRISGVAHPDEALSEALKLYEEGRRAVGLARDDKVSPSLVPLP